MYTLLSGLYKYVFQKDEYCILILGLDNAGKTVCFPRSPAPLAWPFHCLLRTQSPPKALGHPSSFPTQGQLL